MEYLLTGSIVYFILAVLMFYKVGFKSKNDEFISLDTTKYLKGFSILIIIIHHFYLNRTNIGLLFPFTKLGYLGVTIFMFLSGYGIAKSFEKNGLNKFWIKRLKRVYLPFIGINFLTIILYHIILKKNFSLLNIGMYTLGLKLIDPVLWYVLSILFFIYAFMYFLSIYPLTKQVKCSLVLVLYM